MDIKTYKIIYKSGYELQVSRSINYSPAPSNIRDGFEAYLKTGKQTEFAYEFSSDINNGGNTDIEFVIDFKEVCSIEQIQK